MAHRYGVLGELDVPLALGLLRLSTEGRPDEATALAVIHRALDAGIRVLDTADSYALDDKDFHYGEKLARKAVAAWEGPRDEVRVLTKVGMARPKGRWTPAARPERIRARVAGSLEALGTDALFMLLLHGNDPGTPFEDQLATLAALQREGKVRHLGLCNVDVAEVEQARRHFEVAAIQNELSVMSRAAATGGTLELARRLGVPFLAHRPMGGHAKVGDLEKNRIVKPIAERHDITRAEAALAVLLDLGPPIVPLFGATKPERIDSGLRTLRIRLDATDRAGLRTRASFEPDAAAAVELEPVPPREVRPGTEVVIVMGIQGSGKTSLVERYTDTGFTRLNRDLLGGTLADLVPMLTRELTEGGGRVVLDNTYPTRVSRRPVIRAAQAAGAPVRCIHVATPPRDAMINVVLRILGRYQKLLGAEELKELGKTDPNLPPPQALARWAACFEPPAEDEGFAAVETVPFVRRPEPTRGRALLLDVDGTLRRTRSGEPYPRDPTDIEVVPERAEVLRRWIADGYHLYFVSNQSGVASEKVSLEMVQACFDRTIELLGVPVADVAFCPHSAFPVGCFCRKPGPGLGVYLARKHGFALGEAIMVGDLDSDQRFAEAIGARYQAAEAFFGAPWPSPA